MPSVLVDAFPHLHLLFGVAFKSCHFQARWTDVSNEFGHLDTCDNGFGTKKVVDSCKFKWRVCTYNLF